MDNMDSAKSQLLERLKTVNSVLVTVSRDPSVDQLAACLGLTLLINKMKKHGSAVFSGKIPSTIEFLKPEETLEKTPDSLRDFIIALDKNKADKLRYKVEDQMVKIFITPYKTSLSEEDLEFSQGDFNVELIIALGVKQQEDLDQAITAHGRILHDATVACITTEDQSNLGSINWRDQSASSLCELVTNLTDSLGDNLIDEQIATALLTGIIAETDRFSNQKTTSQTMSVSAKLMAAGANQQLVASNLADTTIGNDQKQVQDQAGSPNESVKANAPDDGTLSIKHDHEDLDITALPEPKEEQSTPDILDTSAIDQPSSTQSQPPAVEGQSTNTNSSQRIITEPPTLSGTLTANSMPEQYDPSTDPLSNMNMSNLKGSSSPAVEGKNTTQPENMILGLSSSKPAYTPPPVNWTPPSPVNENNSNVSQLPAQNDTLADLEHSVDSPHIHKPDVGNARQKVETILSETPEIMPKPNENLNALPLGEPLHDEEAKGDQISISEKTNIAGTTGLDSSLFSEVPSEDSGQAPPVPPPIPFPNDQNK